jgi:hypothetical protein
MRLPYTGSALWLFLGTVLVVCSLGVLVLGRAGKAGPVTEPLSGAHHHLGDRAGLNWASKLIWLGM